MVLSIRARKDYYYYRGSLVHCGGHILSESGPSNGRLAKSSFEPTLVHIHSMAILPGLGLNTMHVSFCDFTTMPEVGAHGVWSASVHDGMSRSFKAAQLVIMPVLQPTPSRNPCGSSQFDRGGVPESAFRIAAGSPYPLRSSKMPEWYWPASVTVCQARRRRRNHVHWHAFSGRGGCAPGALCGYVVQCV